MKGQGFSPMSAGSAGCFKPTFHGVKSIALWSQWPLWMKQTAKSCLMTSGPLLGNVTLGSLPGAAGLGCTGSRGSFWLVMVQTSGWRLTPAGRQWSWHLTNHWRKFANVGGWRLMNYAPFLLSQRPDLEIDLVASPQAFCNATTRNWSGGGRMLTDSRRINTPNAIVLSTVRTNVVSLTQRSGSTCWDSPWGIPEAVFLRTKGRRCWLTIPD